MPQTFPKCLRLHPPMHGLLNCAVLKSHTLDLLGSQNLCNLEDQLPNEDWAHLPQKSDALEKWCGNVWQTSLSHKHASYTMLQASGFSVAGQQYCSAGTIPATDQHCFQHHGGVLVAGRGNGRCDPLSCQVLCSSVLGSRVVSRIPQRPRIAISYHTLAGDRKTAAGKPFAGVVADCFSSSS